MESNAATAMSAFHQSCHGGFRPEAAIHLTSTLHWHRHRVSMLEAAKIAFVMVGAATAPIMAIDIDIARYRRWRWFHPKDGFSSVIILCGLLFCLAYVTQSWLLPFPWPGLIMPTSTIVWFFYFRRKRIGSVL